MLTDKARQALKNLLPDLQAFWRSDGCKMDDATLALHVEKRFGPRLMTEVCDVLGVYEMACWYIAILAMREKPT